MEKINLSRNNVDLSRFGLMNDEVDSTPDVETVGFGIGGYQPANHNELFAGEEVIIFVNLKQKNFYYIILYIL